MLPGCVMGGVLFHLRTREKRCESEERIDYARRAVCVCKCVCVCVGGTLMELLVSRFGFFAA